MTSRLQDKNPIVRTVCGDIPAQETGLTHCHEHTFILPGRASQIDPDCLLDEFEKTTAELRDFRAAEGRTVVDAQAIGPERAPLLQRQASEASGVNIIAATGFHRAVYYAPDHFVFKESAEQLAQRMISEITEGMAIYNGPEVSERTSVLAGVIKFATDYYAINDHARKVAEAAAIAHKETGAPIITHTERGTCALEQIQLFEELGVSPGALIISHMDRNLDLYLHEDVAAAGAFLVFDGISRVEIHPDSQIIQIMRRLIETGHGTQVLLGMDMGRRSMWRHYGGGPGLTYVATVFLAKLRRAGLTQEPIEMFTMRNPAVALSFHRSCSCEPGAAA
ncbi:MAG: phosphotriesterase family protein [Planctomycetota bacterium]